MNWTFLLTLYGTPPDGPNPLLKYLAENSTHVLVGSNDEALGYHLYEGEVPKLIENQQPRPFGYYCFSDTMPDELLVPNRGKTFFNYFHGQLADDEAPRVLLHRLLNLNREGPPPSGTNYTELIHRRVMAGLHGKFSAMIAELGTQHSFIFRNQKLGINAWLICFCGMFYLMVSNNERAANVLEDKIIGGPHDQKETYFQQNLELPPDSTLVLRPVFAIPKFRDRMRAFTDKSTRKLLIVNYFRRYFLRQCIT